MTPVATISTTNWVITIVALLVIIGLDFAWAVARREKNTSMREATAWSVFYVSLAVAFGLFLSQWLTSREQQEFFAGWLTEYSLSFDNLFVFVIILAQFAVPGIYHQRILLFGVILALVLRTIFIAVGAAALAAFAFTFVIFGAILIWTGVGLFKHWDEDPTPGDNKLVKIMRKRIAMVDEYHGTKLFIRQNGKRYATPMFMVMVAIASTDLLFALDSIPATFGVTSETFLVFSANAFALLGLRALYFLVKGLLDRLVYLSLGLSIILMFIGVKLIMTYLHEEFASIPKIPTSISLGVIGMILLVATVASLVKTKSDPTVKAHAGRITGSQDHEARDS